MKRNATTYETLLDDIATLYEEKIGMGVRERNEQLVTSYWEIGDRIVSSEKEDGKTARYGKQLIKRLSADLTDRFGSGFGQTNIFTIRRFRLEFRRRELHPFLTWSHYKTLLGVKDRERRRELTEQAITEELPDTRLKALVRLANGISVEKVEEKLPEPRRGSLYLYEVTVDEHNGTKKYLLDCGFKVQRQVKLNGVRRLKNGDLLHSVKNRQSDYRFERGDFKRGDRYCYRGEVLDVIDGDTVKVRVDLGFDTFIDERFRLRGVDAPELGTKEGARACRFVKSRIQPDAPVLIFTYGSDIYGRYLADIFYSNSEPSMHPTVETGVFLNQEILTKGVAAYWGSMKW